MGRNKQEESQQHTEQGRFEYTGGKYYHRVELAGVMQDFADLMLAAGSAQSDDEQVPETIVMFYGSSQHQEMLRLQAERKTREALQKQLKTGLNPNAKVLLWDCNKSGANPLLETNEALPGSILRKRFRST